MRSKKLVHFDNGPRIRRARMPHDDVDDLLDELDDLLNDSPPGPSSTPSYQPRQPQPAHHQQTGAAPSFSSATQGGRGAGGLDDDLDALLSDMDGMKIPPSRSAPSAPPARPASPSASSSSTSDEHATTSRCSKCDLRVLRFVDKQWAADADYMFFRNFMPNVSKLQAKLRPADGKCAFSCQCKWVTKDFGAPHGVSHWFNAPIR